MGPRSLLLTALLASGLAAGCGGGDSPEPVPSPSPTRAPTSTPTGSPVPTDENCPPIPGFSEQLVTIALRNTTPLPDGGRIRLAEVAPKFGGNPASVVVEVTRNTPGCPTDAVQLEIQESGGATVRGLKIDVVAVTPSGTGGSVPTAQLRIGSA